MANKSNEIINLTKLKLVKLYLLQECFPMKHCFKINIDYMINIFKLSGLKALLFCILLVYEKINEH